MRSRAIDVSAEERRATPAGALPELMWVPVAALVVNETYQRPIEKRGWRAIRKIADHFAWGRFSPLLVSRRADGRFALIDGQHRAHAAALCGIETVPALVAELSEQEQAAAFAWVNGQVTALTPQQVFRAALAAGEPWALRCDEVVRAAGCRMMTFNKSSKDRKPGEVFCVRFVREAIEDGKARYLAAVLEGLRAAPTGGDAHFFSATVLKALVGAVAELGVASPAKVEAFLRAHDLWRVEKRVHTLRARDAFRDKTFTALYEDSLRVLFKTWLNGGAP